MAARRWVMRSTVVVGLASLSLVAAGPIWACEKDPTGAAVASEQSLAAARAASDDPGAVKNVELLGNLPEAEGAISINFIEYGRHRDVMFVSGEFGLKSYDISTDPAHPRLLDEVSLPGFWETEDTEVDSRRKLVFLAQDPRAFGGNTRTGESGVHIVDVRHPDDMEIISFVDVPAGHTTSCVNDCRYLWTNGPARAEWMPEDWGGRPIWVTDIRNPRKPKIFPEPIDLRRNDGRTDYVHDIQVDSRGIAWSSGNGGVRGYWTRGLHYDPVEGRDRVARPWDPVPYAGGGISELATSSRFMHNTFRPVGPTEGEAHDPEVWGDELIYVTEETFRRGCATDGALVISSLEGSYDGQGWRSTPEEPFRLQTVGTWSVHGQEGTLPDDPDDSRTADCSAHYFTVQDGILVQSFYSQGTHFIDVRDPTNPTQIAYFRPADARSWAAYWHGDLIYVADNTRGVDVLRLEAD